MTPTCTTSRSGVSSEAKSVGNHGGLAHHGLSVAGERNVLTVFSTESAAKTRKVAVGTAPVCDGPGFGGRYRAVGGGPAPCSQASCLARFSRPIHRSPGSWSGSCGRSEGLPLSWYDVLVQLNEAGGEIRMHRLASSLLLSRSATTRFVERLERAGLLCATAPRTIAGEPSSDSPTRAGTPCGGGRVHLRGVKRHFGDIISNETPSSWCGP